MLHSSSDGQRFETRTPTINARYSPKYFGLKKGIVAYTLLAKSRAVQRAYWYTWASGYKSASGIFDFTGLERFDGTRSTATRALRAYRKVARALSSPG